MNKPKKMGKDDHYWYDTGDDGDREFEIIIWSGMLMWPIAAIIVLIYGCVTK